MNKFYIDSCIYLNLWKKERKGKILFWKIAKDFFEKYDNNYTVFYYSGYILKELKHIISENEYTKKRIKLLYSSNFKKLKLHGNSYTKARKIEYEINYKLSLFDIIHMLLTKQSNSILLTRDNLLLKYSKLFSIKAKKPEELL